MKRGDSRILIISYQVLQVFYDVRTLHTDASDPVARITFFRYLVASGTPQEPSICPFVLSENRLLVRTNILRIGAIMMFWLVDTQRLRLAVEIFRLKKKCIGVSSRAYTVPDTE